MIPADSPNRLLDRRIQYCQFRIQQSLSLYDAEITRLDQRLNLYKSQIIENRDKIIELENRITEQSISIDGYHRIRNADTNTNISKIKARHYYEIQEMRQQFASDIQNLQQNFEITLNNINTSKTTQNAEYLIQIQKETENLKDQIKSYKDAMQKFNISQSIHDDEDESVLQEWENSSALNELRRAIENRSKERYESLFHSKNKLNECVDKLDEITRQHAVQVKGYLEQLNTIEEQYQTSIRKLNEKHEIKIISLKKQLKETDKRANILFKAAHRLGEENKRQLYDTKHDLENMKNNTSAINGESSFLDDGISSTAKSKLGELKSDIARLLKKLRVKEEELLRKRSENETIKREIGRINHEIKFLNRPKLL
ncbi:hypothetical protein TRFO_40099 [Tritrichomonas foetus]|uniref:Uncharacterized protein n=1 Tax=Tritrichomonas foetus TaxID=1144522 RepID=A0A1J4J2K8_9EUKA|nr:hypothetical protein TRFO_40099 [Tritrichomonas foetus]|eukprot:OHS93610.1 hypothetical protein TRFO_40099 [Tritrichomonas foetus]